MAKKVTKTNAIRIVEQQKIEHEQITYDVGDGKIDGESVAQKLGEPLSLVFKTLVATAGRNTYYVFVVPVSTELDLKAAAKVAGEKKIEMIAVKELLPLTGYIRGGCSPVGMKKIFPTYIDASATKLGQMIVSAGRIGLQVKLAPSDLAKLTNAQFADITIKYPCPCCAELTFELEPPGTYDICSNCNWEDDSLQFEDPNYAGGANRMSLNEAKAAFAYGDEIR